MYAIHYRRWFNTVNDFYVYSKNHRTIEEAKQARKVSGDLVVHQATNEVVTDDSWLFDWEKTKPDSYARKAIEHAKSRLVSNK